MSKRKEKIQLLSKREYLLSLRMLKGIEWSNAAAEHIPS